MRPGNQAPNRLAITAVEFDVLWEWLGLGATPVVLRLDSPGRTHTERREIVNTSWQALRQRGLADDTGPDPEIIRLMHLFAVPTEQVELRMWAEQETRVLATGRAGRTALAVRQGSTLTLSGASRTPNRAVLGTLPPAPAGAGRSVTLPSADLDAAREGVADGCPMHEGLIARGVAADDAELAEDILGATVGHGQISVLVADSWGVPHRLRRFIGVLDTRHGRYVVNRAPAGDGTEWTTVAPTDPRRMLYRMDELLAEAAAHANRI
jgi:hypothetical protein